MARCAFVLVALLCVACGDDSSMKDAAVPDAGGCFACAPGTVCVQKFDGLCGSTGPHCVPSTLTCPANTCSQNCLQDLCGGGDGGSGYQCSNRIQCGTEDHNAFTCYGP
jgi:hypothetical protein